MKERLLNKLYLDYWLFQIARIKSLIIRPLYQRFIIPRKVTALRRRKIIKVLFVIQDLPSWKSENLYLEMLKHSRFDAKLLLVPTKEDSYSYDIAKDYLIEKGYTYETLENGEKIKDKIAPDIIFYGKPYAGVIDWKLFYTNNLESLFCYVHYCFRARNSPDMGKIKFFDFSWQLYAENKKVIEEMESVLKTHGKNMVHTGLPIMDYLLQEKSIFSDPWLPLSGGRKRIIYAPHHTIHSEEGKFGSPFYYATFLNYADFMLDMAEKYKDKVQWAFKPHPLLRSKLYKVWGKEKTDSYYQRWKKMDNCQIAEGEYIGLFKYSDAMIHDSGSFKLEYLYTDNPVMYLVNEKPVYDYENWQTSQALELHYKGYSKEDIEHFLQNVINNIDPLSHERKKFIDNFLTPPNGKTACENIINAILGEKEYE